MVKASSVGMKFWVCAHVPFSNYCTFIAHFAKDLGDSLFFYWQPSFWVFRVYRWIGSETKAILIAPVSGRLTRTKSETYPSVNLTPFLASLSRLVLECQCNH